MNVEIRKLLIDLAKRKTTWTYSQLNEQLQLGLDFNSAYDRDAIGELLGEVSMHEYNRGRPLISALITRKSNKREWGDGLYKLFASIYGENWQDLKSDKEWENEEISKCYTFWTNLENYKKFKNDY